NLQPLADVVQCSAGYDFASVHECGAVLECVVLVAVDVGLDDQVGGMLPNAAVHLLRNGEALDNDIKKMSRAVFVGPVPFEMDGEHTLGTHFAQWDARDGVSEHADNREASANFYRQKHSGIGTTCPNRIDERPGVENDAISGREIR